MVLDALLAISELNQEPDNLDAYVFRVVRNKALHVRKRSKRIQTESSLAEFVDTREQTADQQVFTAQVLKHLEKLEFNQQQVLIMKLFGDLTFHEIAEITASNPNTVTVFLRAVLKILHQKETRKLRGSNHHIP